MEEAVILPFPALFAAVAFPFLAGLVMLLIGSRVSGKTIAAVSATTLAFSLGVFSTVSALWPGRTILDPPVFSHQLIGNFAMVIDGLSAPFALSILLVTLIVSLYSLPYMERRIEEMEHEGEHPQPLNVYYSMYLMFSAAMLGTVMSTNLVEFYVFLELSLIPSFMLIALYGYGERIRIAIMYLIWTHVGALAFLVGVLGLGFAIGTFDVIDVATGITQVGLGEALPGAFKAACFAAIALGLFVKMAIFGVHIWLPYAHAEAPTPISALLSPNLIGIAGYGLIRFSYMLFNSFFQVASPYLLLLALVTMIYGGLMALAQDDIKRLLAYSSISQMGYILLGVASATALGMAGAALHYVSHAVGKAVLFMVAGTLIFQGHGLRSISKMGGLAQKMPLTASLALIGFMHITGIPPTIGFWSEVMIVLGAVGRVLDGGTAAFALLLLALLIAIGLSTAYSFITLRRAFFGKLPETLSKMSDGPGILMVPIALIAAAGLLFFFVPAYFVDPLMKVLPVG